MKNPLCDELLIYQPTGTEVEDFYPWYIVSCVLNILPTITAIVLNSVTIQALRKASSLSKPLRTLQSESCFYWPWCGFTVPSFCHSVSDQVVTAIHGQLSNLCWLYHIYVYHRSAVCSFVSRRHISECRQVLGNSSSSQIPGTCDSQTCCCCSSLDVGVQYVSFAIQIIGLY